MKLKRISTWGLMLGVLTLLVCMLCYSWIERVATSRVLTNIDEVGKYDVALVLGTSKRLKNGRNNLYFYNRIDAAAELYFKGKVKKILVSGDNAEHSYNEPRDMLNALIAKGVDPSDIILDYAGFRTFDSMIRAKEVFGQTRFIVVSQQFHAERAVYIGRANNMDVVGFVAKGPKFGQSFIMFREVLARTKALLDCNVLGTTPKFLGERIDVGV